MATLHHLRFISAVQPIDMRELVPRFDWTSQVSPGFASFWWINAPYWLILLLSAIAPALWLRNPRRAKRRARLGLCPKCGYDLRASPDRCPECGHATVAPPSA